MAAEFLCDIFSAAPLWPEIDRRRFPRRFLSSSTTWGPFESKMVARKNIHQVYRDASKYYEGCKSLEGRTRISSRRQLLGDWS
ncbi:hypothetical protein J6590_031278 [Homalodisca vitripennis]|nr:hypothetical protein J6590_031278 [Homalodisca vitripennis]